MVKPVDAVDEAIKQWATDRQREYIDAVNAHGSLRAASRALGVNFGAVRGGVEAAKRRAAAKGYSPHEDARGLAPEGFRVRGKSILYDKEGRIAATWVKTNTDHEAAERMVRAAVEALAEEVKGLAPLVPAPEAALEDLLTVYPLGDPHVGMYAWAAETGDDFDLDIARRITLGAVDRLVSSAPPSHTAILLPLGDVFHMDDQSNQTPVHRHQLDADSRFVKVLQVGIEMFRHAVLRALEKHTHVVVRFVQGNHDPHAVWSLAFTIGAYFAADPRVTVDLSPSKFWYYRFGQVLIGATHGDTVKHDALLGVMATDRARDWGETRHRYFLTGHVHKTTVTELAGLVCESFRTLAAKDAFAASHGYRPGRDMVAIVYHKGHGEIERHRCDVGMLA